MIQKLDLRIQKILHSSISEIEKWPSKQKSGIVEFNTKMKLEEMLLRVIIVLKKEVKELPGFIGAHKIIDFRGKFVVGQFALRELKRLALLDEIEQIGMPGPLSEDLKQGLTSSGWNLELSEDLRTRLGLETDLDGSGILIGFIDSGIDYRHPDFRDENGNTIIEWIYEDEANQWDEAIINQAISTQNYSLVSHIDGRGHGTGVAACAASTGQGTGYRGVAPGAKLLMMASTTGNLLDDNPDNDYLEAIIRLKDYMENDPQQRPLVINMSKGENEGSRDGNLPFEQWLDQLLTDYPRIVFCKSAGNDGDKEHHAKGNVNTDEAQNIIPSIEVYETGGEGNFLNSFFLKIYYSLEDEFELSLIGPTGIETGAFEEIVGTFPTETIELDNNILATVSYVENSNFKSFVILINQAVTANLLSGQYSFRLRNANSGISQNGEYHIWLDHSSFDRISIQKRAKFLPPHLDLHYTLNAGASGHKPIIVGAYNDDDGKLSKFSGKGPTRDERLGIDIVAPGLDLIRARALNTVPEFLDQQFLFSAPGTSFSCPLVAGTAALILQKEIADNGIAPLGDELKLRLQNFSRKDFFGGNLPNSAFGHGKLDIISSVNELDPLLFDHLFFDTRPRLLLLNQNFELFLELRDELGRPIRFDGNYHLSAKHNSREEFEEINNGFFTNGGDLIAVPALEVAGIWEFQVDIPDLNHSEVIGIEVHRFFPEVTNESLEDSDLLFEDGFSGDLVVQYYFDGTRGHQELIKGLAWYLSSNSRLRSGYFKQIEIRHGTIPDEDFQFGDNLFQNRNAIENENVQILEDIELTALANGTLWIPFENPLLYHGYEKLLIEISLTHPSSSIKTLRIPFNETHIQYKKWQNSSLIENDSSFGIEAPILLADDENRLVDLWIKQTRFDTGQPIEQDLVFYSSPDIRDLDFVVIRVEIDNQFFFTVRNRGSETAQNVEFKLYWSDGELQDNVLHPSSTWHESFFSFIDESDERIESNSRLINIVPDSTIEEERDFQKLEFRWNPSNDTLVDNQEKVIFIIAELKHPSDPLYYGGNNSRAIRLNNNIAANSFRLRPNTRIDLWFKANPNDDGSRENPVTDNQNSPDIIIKQSATAIGDNTADDPFLFGQDMHIYVKVRNFNFTEVSDANVHLRWTSDIHILENQGIRSDFIQAEINGSFQESSFVEIDNIRPNNPNDPDPDQFQLAHFIINIPLEESRTMLENKLYLIVQANHSSDFSADGYFESSFSSDNNYARKIVQALPQVDLWIQDSIHDDAFIPSEGDYENSPDIAIHHQLRSDPFGIESGTDIIAGQSNYIYVRVRNNSKKPVSKAKLELFWTEISRKSRDDWNQNFISGDLANSNLIEIDAIEGSGSTVKVFRFQPPRNLANAFLEPGSGIYFIAVASHRLEPIGDRLSSVLDVPLFNNVACKRLGFRNTLKTFIALLLARIWAIIRRRLGI